MPKEVSFAQQTRVQCVQQLRALLAELPPSCADFLDGVADTVSVRTRLAYAYDLRVFFRYLSQSLPAFQSRPITSITDADLQTLTARDLERYQLSLTLYEHECPNGQPVVLTNEAPGKMRKMSALRSYYNYMFSHNRLSANTASLVPLPTRHAKPIIHLEVDEIARLLDEVESGQSLSDRQQAYHALTKTRDLALLTLLLGTGIRVSECVGMDLGDINFAENAFRVTRKGGDQTVLYFSEETAQALRAYLAERSKLETLPGHEQALFLSIQRRRITARAVQQLTKKYAAIAAPLKKISPHKLRSTYGTQLYRESGDIYLVAEVLGHSDVNTTRRHYAAMSEERRRRAASMVVLREDPKDLTPR